MNRPITEGIVFGPGVGEGVTVTIKHIKAYNYTMRYMFRLRQLCHDSCAAHFVWPDLQVVVLVFLVGAYLWQQAH